jgi:hypothetical protein
MQPGGQVSAATALEAKKAPQLQKGKGWKWHGVKQRQTYLRLSNLRHHATIDAAALQCDKFMV